MNGNATLDPVVDTGAGIDALVRHAASAAGRATVRSLARRPRGLRSFAADAAALGPLTPHALGLRTVRLAHVVGSVGRADALRRDFRPRRRWKQDDERYRSIVRAVARGTSLPAIELYKLDGRYYVLDGNHRVAAYRAAGQVDVDAVVTEFVPLDDEPRRRVFAERRRFERATGLTEIETSLPGSYRRLQEMIEELAGARAVAPGDKDGLRRAAARWWTTAWRPAEERLDGDGFAHRFPGAWPADVLVLLAHARGELAARGGGCLGWDDALEQVRAQLEARRPGLGAALGRLPARLRQALSTWPGG